MSISQNFPAISPSLSLNFARSKTLDPRITFSRTSTATRVNETGLIEVMSADEPRFDHKYENGIVKSLGLLIEEQRTNLVINNEDLSQWNLNSTPTVTSNDTVSPDGNTTADKVIQGGQVFAGVSTEMSGITTNTVYSCSVFIKPDGDTRTRFGFYDTGNWQGYLDTDWSSGEPSTNTTNSSDIVYEEYPNGWYRVSFKASTQSNAFAGTISFHCHPDRTGTGKSAWFWGAQLEKGSFPTSYIPNDTGSQKTRNPDNVSMTGTNLTDWFNDNEGTVILNMSEYKSTLGGSFSISFGSAGNNYLAFPYITGSGTLSGDVYYRDPSFGETANLPDGSIVGKYGVVYEKELRLTAYFNGVLGQDSPGPFPNPSDFTSLLMGRSHFAGGNYHNIHIKQLLYYPKSVTNAQLQNLTK